MDITKREPCVLGIGHLAAAVRVQLSRRAAAGGDCAARDALFLACSDYANTSSFADANFRAVRSRSPILFAWISDSVFNLGPLVMPREAPCFACHLTRRWDFSLSDAPTEFVSAAGLPTRNTDIGLRAMAHLGSLLIACELSRDRFGAELIRLVGRVAKFDAPDARPEILEWHPRPGCRVCQ